MINDLLTPSDSTGDTEDLSVVVYLLGEVLNRFDLTESKDVDTFIEVPAKNEVFPFEGEAASITHRPLISLRI